jgi:NADH:ubiquinone oxidoreductase subunit K
MTIHQLFLLTAAALFSVGLFGALSQQSIVMLMMGLELMVNGVIWPRSRSGTSRNRPLRTDRSPC